MSVQSHLETIASKLVLTTSERNSIETSITTLKGKIEGYFGADLSEQLQFGSSTRGTQLPRNADINSDIDYMIVFKNSAGYKPQTFIERLKRFAENKYPRSEIYQSHPTVVLELSHIKFELVPAYKGYWFDSTYYIPGPTSGFSEWITTDPNGFNKQLSDKNQAHDYFIKPLIRLVKYWNASNGYVYNSYELEESLVNANYWFCHNLKDYFYAAINGLSTWNLPYYQAIKVNRAKEIVQNTKTLEDDNKPYSATQEIKKLIPEI